MEDFGFVQRDAKVLENAGKEGSEENEEGEEEEEGGSKRGSLERKSGGSHSPEVPVEAGEQGKKHRSDSGSSGGSKGKASRLARTMSAYTSKEKPSQHADPSLSTLPQSFMVKYLGKRDARGLWGIKHTRRPVDHMVTDAKGADGHPPLVLPLVKLTVSREGVTLTAAHLTGEKKKKGPEQAVFHPIDTISYGVQDLVYTRVFSMIIVRETTHMLANGQVSPSRILF
ncbi:hypothetical protein J437_LFUL000210 [Ladona fulva]|uniref:Uncharacterized protein n=1 Tax=Ladona fulva TaxID=123851 RepID=A0A8K0JUJ5_LADFU|nr:hypothetical protein J437_LFUL000210 [Ladona fulva]